MSNRIRVPGDSVLKIAFAEVTDLLTSSAPVLKQSSVTDVEVSLYNNGTFMTVFTGFTSITLLVKAQSDLAAAPLISKTLTFPHADWTPAASEANWNAGTAQHAKFLLTSAETFIELDGEKIRDLFLYVYLTNASGDVPYLACPLYLLDSGKGDLGAITVLPAGARMKNSKLQILNRTDGLYYDVELEILQGQTVWRIATTGEA